MNKKSLSGIMVFLLMPLFSAEPPASIPMASKKPLSLFKQFLQFNAEQKTHLRISKHNDKEYIRLKRFLKSNPDIKADINNNSLLDKCLLEMMAKAYFIDNYTQEKKPLDGFVLRQKGTSNIMHFLHTFSSCIRLPCNMPEEIELDLIFHEIKFPRVITTYESWISSDMKAWCVLYQFIKSQGGQCSPIPKPKNQQHYLCLTESAASEEEHSDV